MLADYKRLLKQLLRALILAAHFFVTAFLFYEIVFTGNEEKSEIQANKIQSGLTAAVSFVSLSLTIWYYDVIRLLLDSLRRIDYAMESIGVKAIPNNDARSSNVIECGLCVATTSTYFFTKYVRYRYLTSHDISTSVRHSFTRTCCVTLGELVLITFVKCMDAGRHRFAVLNRWINQEIDDGKLIMNSGESDDINGVYFDIMNYCDLILARYQLQIFLTLISDIVIVIYMVLTAFNEFISGSVALAAIMFCIVDPLIRLTQTVRVMSICTSTISEAQRMANCLQRLMIETSMNAITREKLNLFLMELVDKKLQFVVCGFLSLNNETLVVMTGTVSTYLLIMMQFQPPVD